MMGVQQPPQSSLFYTGINIEKRIRSNHPLRKVNALIDFDFSYNEVKDLYGSNGNVSVPPPVILKLMLLTHLRGITPGGYTNREKDKTISNRHQNELHTG